MTAHRENVTRLNAMQNFQQINLMIIEEVLVEFEIIALLMLFQIN